MEDTLIIFPTAKLAKEKGFNIPTQKAYIGENLFTNFEESLGEREFYFDADDFYENWNKKGWVFNKNGDGCFGCKLDNIKYFEAYSAPTQSLLQRWLREKYNIHISITKLNVYNYRIIKFDKHNLIIKEIKSSNGSYIYKEILEEALQKALKLIK